MSSFRTLMLALVLGCSGGADPGMVPALDAPVQSIDAPGAAITLPTWMLTDIQPASPLSGQTYGQNPFSSYHEMRMTLLTPEEVF